MITAIKHIKSVKFTRKIPSRSKFRLGQTVKLRTLTMEQDFLAIYKENKPGKRCKIVGMQRNSGTGMTNPMNRYYVRYPNGRIYWAPSGHLMPVNQKDADKGKPYIPDTPEYKNFNAQIDALIGKCDIAKGAEVRAAEQLKQAEAACNEINDGICAINKKLQNFIRGQ